MLELQRKLEVGEKCQIFINSGYNHCEEHCKNYIQNVLVMDNIDPVAFGERILEICERKRVERKS